MFENTLRHCSTIEESDGLFVTSMIDYKHAFGSVNFYKFIIQMLEIRVDKHLISATVNLFMPQKV